MDPWPRCALSPLPLRTAEGAASLTLPACTQGVPVGLPIEPNSPARRSPDAASAYLNTLGFPPGIVGEFEKAVKEIPLRIWIVDNSGSMATTDGKRLVKESTGAGHRMIASVRLSEEMTLHRALTSEAAC